MSFRPSLFILVNVTVCLFPVPPINQLTVLSALAIAGGLYFFFVGFRMLSRKRVLLSTPTSKIRSAAMGLVEVNGMATGPYTMPAPFTGKPCFLYHTTAWQRREGKEKQWEKVVDETLHVPFFVDGSTGQLLIEPLGAETHIAVRVGDDILTCRTPPRSGLEMGSTVNLSFDIEQATIFDGTSGLRLC